MTLLTEEAKEELKNTQEKHDCMVTDDDDDDDDDGGGGDTVDRGN